MTAAEPSTARRLGRKGQARHDQIIEVAGRLFGQRGYAAVTFRDIAAEAGMSHSLLVHYFKTKEDLLRAVMTSWRERIEARGVIGETDLEDRARRVVEIAEENETVPDYVALFANLSVSAIDPEHPAHELFADQYQVAHDSMLVFFRWAASTNRLRPGVDPEIAAQSIVALQDGAQLRWLHFPDRIDVPAILRAYLEQVLVDPFEAEPAGTARS